MCRSVVSFWAYIITQAPKGIFSSFSHRWRIKGFPGSLFAQTTSSLRLSGYSVTQWIPSADSPLEPRTQRVLFTSPAPICAPFLNALLAEYPSHRTCNSSSSLCTHALRSMPSRQSFSESLVEFWSSQLCLNYTAWPPEVFSNLTGLPSPGLLIPVPCLSTSSSDSSEFRSASSYALVFRVSTLCHALTTWNLKELSNLKSNKTPCNDILTTYNCSIKWAHTHRHPFNTEHVQEKTVVYIN